MEHAWKACKRDKRFVGSNPTSSEVGREPTGSTRSGAREMPHERRPRRGETSESTSIGNIFLSLNVFNFVENKCRKGEIEKIMRCPFCSHEESKVTDSRTAEQTNAIRRRRECLRCLRRFTTFETVDLTVQILKRSGHYEDFDQEKLVRGLDAACRHTRISRQQVREIAYKITAELMERQLREIEATELGDLAMKYLRQLDTVAYLRLACVYKRFKDVDELKDAIENITPHETQEMENALEESAD